MIRFFYPAFFACKKGVTPIVRPSRLYAFLLLSLCFSLLASACNSSGQSSSGTNAGAQAVAAEFREFYQKLGGKEVLGPAISASFTYENLQCQYTANALLCLDPILTDANRFRLYPLGNRLDMREEPGNVTSESGERMVNGYRIAQEFVGLYDMLFPYTGNPLTQLKLNYTQQRMEQYFENVGFYRRFSDPPGSVRLLAYGSYACGDNCRYSPAVDARIYRKGEGISDQPFQASLERLGGEVVFGKPLTQPFIAADGNQEQVYETAVFYAPPEHLENIRLRPLPTLLNMLSEEPGPKKYGSKDGMVFYSVKGSLGYHVPEMFDQFITAHGGTGISGQPIAGVIEYMPGVARQCFENYCLDYDTNAQNGERVKMAPLGALYLKSLQGQVNPPKEIHFSTDTVLLQTAELYPLLSPKMQQQVRLLVQEKGTAQPIMNVEATLSVELDGVTLFSGTFPKTQADGFSSLVLPAFDMLSPGTVVPYRVCLNVQADPAICRNGNFLIWKR